MWLFPFLRLNWVFSPFRFQYLIRARGGSDLLSQFPSNLVPWLGSIEQSNRFCHWEIYFYIRHQRCSIPALMRHTVKKMQGKLRAFPHFLGNPSLCMIWHPIPCEFPFMRKVFLDFFFISVSWHFVYVFPSLVLVFLLNLQIPRNPQIMAILHIFTMFT